MTLKDLAAPGAYIEVIGVKNTSFEGYSQKFYPTKHIYDFVYLPGMPITKLEIMLRTDELNLFVHDPNRRSRGPRKVDLIIRNSTFTATFV